MLHQAARRTAEGSARADAPAGSGTSLARRRDEGAALLEDELVILRQAGPEARLADREVVVPHPDEAVVEAQGPHGVQLREEPRAPRAQRQHVAVRDVARAAQEQAG